MVGNFKLASIPRIIFGSGKIRDLPEAMLAFGSQVLLVTGRRSFVDSQSWDQLLLQLETSRIRWQHVFIETEPSPEMIDTCVSDCRNKGIDVVVAIGGGSVMDAGKAISGMLCEEGSVIDFLEGIGTRNPSGAKIPFIAVPTTSGTGSEMTKNAVISQVGREGFKRSIRHDRYIPNVALIDPTLTIDCPAGITAYSGMDAFTQLLESYLSSNANPMTDALAVDGIRKIRDGLLKSFQEGDDIQARESMAYAAMISGITLANAGLGTIHGFASSIGGFFAIPHGLICARMMLPVNQITVASLRSSDEERIAIDKYARIGKLFSKDKNLPDDSYVELLLETIQSYSEKLSIPGLRTYGVDESDIQKIISSTGNKNNPVVLSDEEMYQAVIQAL